jgi:hypothetical protein
MAVILKIGTVEGEDASRMRDGIPQSRDGRMERSLFGGPRVFARKLG